MDLKGNTINVSPETPKNEFRKVLAKWVWNLLFVPNAFILLRELKLETGVGKQKPWDEL